MNREEIKARAQQRVAEDKPFDAPFYSVDFVESEILRAMRECTKLVCGSNCRPGHRIYDHDMWNGVECPAAPIHAKIKELEL